MLLAKPVSIDVIAHHEMQLQACAAVVAELGKKHSCNILLGQDVTPTDAEVAILADHCAFQPRVTKENYRYIVHMSHDLADSNVYVDERKGLKDVDIFLVPGEMHFSKAVKAFPGTPVYQIGWPKYDLCPTDEQTPPEYRVSNSDQKVVIYAPTYLAPREWEELLPALLQTGHLILVKNHVHYNFEAGDAPPLGCEEEYTAAIKSLLDMEAYLKTSGFTNYVCLDRRSNICDLFRHADILVTDLSSCAMEFLPFGPCIETGRFGQSKSETTRNSSQYSDAAHYLPIDLLLPKLADSGWLNTVVGTYRTQTQATSRFIYKPLGSSAALGAELIDAHLYLWQNELQVEPTAYLKRTKSAMREILAVKNKIRGRLKLS